MILHKGDFSDSSPSGYVAEKRTECCGRRCCHVQFDIELPVGLILALGWYRRGASSKPMTKPHSGNHLKDQLT